MYWEIGLFWYLMGLLGSTGIWYFDKLVNDKSMYVTPKHIAFIMLFALFGGIPLLLSVGLFIIEGIVTLNQAGWFNRPINPRIMSGKVSKYKGDDE